MAQVRRSVAASRLQDTVGKRRDDDHVRLEADKKAGTGTQCTKVERKRSSSGRGDAFA